MAKIWTKVKCHVFYGPRCKITTLYHACTGKCLHQFCLDVFRFSSHEHLLVTRKWREIHLCDRQTDRQTDRHGWKACNVALYAQTYDYSHKQTWWFCAWLLNIIQLEFRRIPTKTRQQTRPSYFQQPTPTHRKPQSHSCNNTFCTDQRLLHRSSSTMQQIQPMKVNLC